MILQKLFILLLIITVSTNTQLLADDDDFNTHDSHHEGNLTYRLNPEVNNPIKPGENRDEESFFQFQIGVLHKLGTHTYDDALRYYNEGDLERAWENIIPAINTSMLLHIFEPEIVDLFNRIFNALSTNNPDQERIDIAADFYRTLIQDGYPLSPEQLFKLALCELPLIDHISSASGCDMLLGLAEASRSSSIPDLCNYFMVYFEALNSISTPRPPRENTTDADN